MDRISSMVRGHGYIQKRDMFNEKGSQIMWDAFFTFLLPSKWQNKIQKIEPFGGLTNEEDATIIA